ncbi:DNA cytosine methyltransferase [Pararoseomonas indoligenes]|uniref:DNA (cytosine-5-)-methyltransferase n=1 Tax=Roseomonas indoligenes TaxID=2820811 RepID=A0A940S8K8_9PROT|nr:DNA cytosine methyltransferase [Pararoseomonas indoligenes]MBP0496015.1 DNA cytosine methyltransferase [Pararoseomonas indoligenes]
MSREDQVKTTVTPPRKARFLAVDFFCGAGGTTRGLIDAGGYVIAGIDKDAGCEATYSDPLNNVNFGLDRKPPRFLHRDIFPRSAEHPDGEQKELMADLEELIGRYRNWASRMPLLFAVCAPCQPFTKLARVSMTDERKARRARDANLLKEACRFIRKFKPDMVLSENVAGIGDPQYGGVWDRFHRDLEKMGYATGSKVVCTSKFGVPQYRKRSILMGVKRYITNPERFADLLGRELLVPDSDPDAPLVSVQEAIGHLPSLQSGEAHPYVPNHRARGLAEVNRRRLAASKPGKSNAYMADTEYGDLTLPCHQRVNDKFQDRCFGDVYTRMRPHQPSPTITTRCISISNGRFGHYDVNQIRAITVREAALIQSFPETYRFHPLDEMEAGARMVGNAVPPKLARFFASYLVNSLSSNFWKWSEWKPSADPAPPRRQ